jgi:DNA-binding MarR family transcriptional regulator
MSGMSETEQGTVLQTANRMHGSVSRLFHRLRITRAAGGLSMAKLGVLSQLRREGVTTVTALADYLGVQPQSLTRLLADSETEGFIKRNQDQADKRRCLIEITPAGSRLLAEEGRKRETRLAAAMTLAFTPTEQELIRIASDLMDRLADAIEPEGISAVKTQSEETS